MSVCRKKCTLYNGSTWTCINSTRWPSRPRGRFDVSSIRCPSSRVDCNFNVRTMFIGYFLLTQKNDLVLRGMHHAFVEILRTEGVGALYRVSWLVVPYTICSIQGFWMTLPQLSASFLYSSTYERSRDLIQTYMNISNPSLLSALAGTSFSFV